MIYCQNQLADFNSISLRNKVIPIISSTELIFLLWLDTIDTFRHIHVRLRVLRGTDDFHCHN